MGLGTLARIRLISTFHWSPFRIYRVTVKLYQAEPLPNNGKSTVFSRGQSTNSVFTSHGTSSEKCQVREKPTSSSKFMGRRRHWIPPVALPAASTQVSVFFNRSFRWPGEYSVSIGTPLNTVEYRRRFQGRIQRFQPFGFNGIQLFGAYSKTSGSDLKTIVRFQRP